MLIIWILAGAALGFVWSSIIGIILESDLSKAMQIGASIGGILGFIIGAFLNVNHSHKKTKDRLMKLEHSLGITSLDSKFHISDEKQEESTQLYLNKLFKEQQELKARLQKLEAHLNIQPEPSISTEKAKIPDSLVPKTPPPQITRAPENTKTSEQTVQTSTLIKSDSPQTFKAPTKSTDDALTEQAAKISISASQEKIVEPPRTTQPNLFIKILKFIIAFFSEGNSLARIGTILLLIGLGFLIQYAARQSLQLGILAASFTGILLLSFGWILRCKRRIYSLILQGGGIGVFYLSLFAGLKFLPPYITFGSLVLLGIIAAVLAVVQNAPSLAVLATLGGFLSPVLITFNADLQVPLFSYYLVLNIGIAIIAWFKAWRWLNLIGFFFTFAIGTIWGGLNYKPEFFYSTEPFLIAFFVLYIAIAILYASRQPPKLKGLVDGVLVFGLPVIVFSLQAALLQGERSSTTLSSSLGAILYLALSGLLFWLGSKNMRLLSEAFLAIGLAFVTITIPLALGASWTSTGWALEGVGLLWVGLRQNSFWMRISGILAQIAAAIAFWWGIDFLTGKAYSEPIIAFGTAILAFSGIISAYLFYRAREQTNNKSGFFAFKWETKLSPYFLGYGLIWWLVTGTKSIFDLQIHFYTLPALLGFFTITTLACLFFSSKLNWPTLRRPTLLFYFLLIPPALAQADFITHPSANFGWLAWPLVILSHRVALTFCAKLDDSRKWWQNSLVLSHAANLWLIAWLFVFELPYWLAKITSFFALELPHWLTKIIPPEPWYYLSSISNYLALSIIILLVSSRHIRKLSWFKNYKLTYLTWGLTPVAMYLWLEVLILSYYGVNLNNLSLPNFAQGLVLVVLFIWYLRLNESLKQSFLPSIALVAFSSYGALWTLQLLFSQSISDYTLSALTLSFGFLFNAYLAKVSLASYGDSNQNIKNKNVLGVVANTILIMGIFWLAIIAFAQTESGSFLPAYALPTLVGLLTLIALSCNFIGRWLRWPTLQGMGLLLLPVLIVVLVRFHSESLLTGWTTLVWPVAFATYYWLLNQALNLPAADKLFKYFAFAHGLSLWLITYILAIGLTEFSQQTLANNNTWSLVSWGSAMTIMVALLTWESFRNLSWLRPYKERLFTLALTPLSILLWFWIMSANTSSAVATPLNYLPLLNPLDIIQGSSLFVLIWWVRKCRLKFDLSVVQKNTLTIALIIASISWPSIVVFRSVHHLLGVPYNFADLYASNIVQSALSIFWTTFALVAMVIAARLKVRLPWLIGAILLALTVTKLFLVDLSQADTLARVISFIAVGILLLFIGYIAPVPPKANNPKKL